MEMEFKLGSLLTFLYRCVRVLCLFVVVFAFLGVGGVSFGVCLLSLFLLFFFFFFLGGGGGGGVILYVHENLLLLLIKTSLDLLLGAFGTTGALDNIEGLHQIQLNIYLS